VTPRDRRGGRTFYSCLEEGKESRRGMKKEGGGGGKDEEGKKVSCIGHSLRKGRQFFPRKRGTETKAGGGERRGDALVSKKKGKKGKETP